MAKEVRRATKKKAFKNIASGVAHVNSSFNNTKILISDVQGTPLLGRQLGQWDLRVLVSQHHTQLKWLRKMPAKRLKNMV